MAQSLDTPHRRRNLLTGEWVVVSPHRTQRPWQGHEGDSAEPLPEHDPGCYLCPGNDRAGGAVNPDYKDVYVFDNDYPALLDSSSVASTDAGMFQAEPVCGCCRVICYGPQHNQGLHHMPQAAIERVVNAWMEQSRTLSERFEWVQIFENRGSLMGASSPHPHGQIWAVDMLPTEASKEATQQSDYFKQHGRSLLQDYLHQELEAGERIVAENEDWVSLVPYWAVWPFETLVLPRRNVSRLHDLNASEQTSLAEFVKTVFTQYDELFNAPMSYSMGWHSAPASNAEGWQLHMHIYPPALRSATIPKFMVGFELLGEKQRDITAEIAAQRLRDGAG
ncbi:MAG: UDP-glucose--hexose-1-phosphate uridylyltransferase [Gammaproteobacteria bacterium]